MNPLLFDPAWWQARIEKMQMVPRRLLCFPRPDLGVAGVEMTELRLRAHDGMPLKGLLGRSAFASGKVPTRLRIVGPGESEEPDWDFIGEGGADLVFIVPEEHRERRLEDRVLDVLRLICCAATFEGIDTERVTLHQPACRPPADELWIADRLLGQSFC